MAQRDNYDAPHDALSNCGYRLTTAAFPGCPSAISPNHEGQDMPEQRPCRTSPLASMSGVSFSRRGERTMLERKAASTREPQQRAEPQGPGATLAYEHAPSGGAVQATTVVYEGSGEAHVALAATVAVPSSGVRPASVLGSAPRGGGTLPLAGVIPASVADSDAATLVAGSPEIFIADTTAAVRATLSRSAVLPRVEVAGETIQLVLDPKARYEERRVLGAGGVGEVVEALDNDIGRTVALKRLLPEMRAATPLLRFIDEIRTIGGLEHPNIVPIHDVGVDAAGQYYFVMKHVQGETLESIINKLAAGN